MKIAKLILIHISVLILIACGGSSEPLTRDNPQTGGGSTPVVTPSLSLSLTLLDAQGAVSTRLADGAPLTANATVVNQDGVPQSGVVVTFVLSESRLADFSTDTGTALTNDQGVATITMTVGSLSGSGTVSASIENADSVSRGFESLGTQQQTPFSLELFADAVQLASSGGDQIELIAVVKNEQNILLPGVSVSFSADQNAALSNIDNQTGDDGTARAVLSTQNNKQNRQITVTANTSTLSQILLINVVGTEVNINGSSSVIINDSAPITILLSDSDGNGIANQTVTLSTTLGSLDNTSPVTGSNGQVTVNFISSSAGAARISANALNASANFDLTVQQDDFSFTNLPTGNLALSTDQNITLRWFKNNVPFSGGSIVVTTSRGEISVNGNPTNTTTTNSEGIAVVSIRSDFAGPSTISATGEDGSGGQVTARATVEFVASSVDTVFVDASPDLIGPEGQTSTITAVLRDARGNLVKGKTVNFRLISDSSGGSVSPNTATTDSNGIASTVYTSNAVSGDNGVTIGAESDGVEGSTDLTVGDRAFDITLGTGNEILIEGTTTYVKEFAVFVTDSSGRPIANADLTASIVPAFEDAYAKGYWVWDEDNNIYYPVYNVFCSSEDVDGDGLLDATEDRNGDGLLTPGNVTTVSFKDNIARTNEFGQATLQIRYAKQFGAWSRAVLSVFGQSSGTESMESQVFRLSVAASDLTTQARAPASNPFGNGFSCSDTL